MKPKPAPAASNMNRPEKHRPALAEIIERIPCCSFGIRMAEIGVNCGVTSEYLLRRCLRLHMILVDPWSRELVPGTRKTQENFDTAARITRVRAAGRERLKLAAWVVRTLDTAARKAGVKE